MSHALRQLAAMMVIAMLLIVAQSLEFVAEANAQHLSVSGDEHRTVLATRIDSEIAIDGRLDETAWERAEIAEGFLQQRPDPGDEASERTEVRVLYDDRNLYVGMRMYDENPDRIAAELGRRGSTAIYSDWAHVVIDSYLDRRTAFQFSATPSGVKRDVLHFDDVLEDDSWQAVWEVGTSVDSLGWTAEFRIPLSQLRFGTNEGEELIWGINFIRDIARRDERAHWAPIAPDAARFVSSFGTLRGLRGIPSPRRLELTPYLLARGDWVPGDPSDPFRVSGDPGVEVGLDVTYGLGPNLTLTAALNPDFGQVEVDPAQVNLSAFETFFPERRPFFLEGSDIFQFGLNFGSGGDETLFYTRRIGRVPQGEVPGSASHSDVPGSSRILGAAKLSGRVSDWSVGALNAVTAAQSARWTDPEGGVNEATVEPLTNYGVLRVSRDFRDGQSAVGGMVTTVTRDLASDRLEFLPGQAYAAGLDMRHRFAGGDWEASGWLSGSHIRGSVEAITHLQKAPARYFQRPDADHLTLDPRRTSLTGWAGDLTMAKVSGRWRAGAIMHVRSPEFEVNDLGFQRAADLLVGALWLGRVSFQSGKHVRRWDLFSNVYAGSTWGGERVVAGANASGAIELRSGWGASGLLAVDLPMLDPLATRGGPALYRPLHSNPSLRLYSDRRRPYVFEVNLNAIVNHETGGGRVQVGPTASFRPSSRVRASIGPSWSRNVNPAQYVGRGDHDGTPHYLFGELDQTTLSLDGRFDLSFSSQLSLELFVQPFVSVGRYSDFRRVDDPRAREFGARYHTFDPETELRVEDEVDDRPLYGVFPDGETNDPAYTFVDPGFRVRSLRGNAVLRWEYRPGSTLFIVWQQDRSGDGSMGGRPFDLRREARSLFNAPGSHVLLLKVSYWFGR